ncbi:MAG: response regulator [Steroidobacterales bacterium]
MDQIAQCLRVYVVEDSPIIQGLLESIIEAAGAELIGRSAGAEAAVADLSVLQPDLILIDIILESGTGFDVLRALRERKLAPKATKVMLTNHANAEYRTHSFALGAEHFLDKASETSRLLTLLNTLASERRRSRAAPPAPDRS